MNSKEWNPGFIKYNGDGTESFILYEKRWYCNKNKIIHGNENEYLNCKFCSKKL